MCRSVRYLLPLTNQGGWNVGGIESNRAFRVHNTHSKPGRTYVLANVKGRCRTRDLPANNRRAPSLPLPAPLLLFIYLCAQMGGISQKCSDANLNFNIFPINIE